MRILTILSSLASLVALAFATPNPLPGSSTIVLRDPAILYNSASKKYFVFATGNHIPIFTSTSLLGPWTNVGAVLPSCTSITGITPPGNCSLWAPDVHFVNGEYVLYYSVSTGGSQNSAIGVATSPSMEPGTWTDHGQVVRSQSGAEFNSIDPNLVVDFDGELKLGFGSYWGGIYQIVLSSVTTQMESPPGDHLAGGNGRPAEGGFTYQPPGAFYWYEFFSDGITPLQGATSRPAAGAEYKVRVGRGPSASGPFIDQSGNSITEGTTTGALVLGSHDNVYAPGGQSLFRDPVSGRDVIVYHYVKNDDFGGPSYLGINYGSSAHHPDASPPPLRMALLSLSDDVLLLIFSLFRGREALPTCLTCKRVYPLAIAGVASFATCHSPAQLRRLCDYFLSSDPLTGVPRAKYLEDLKIHATTFQQEPDGAGPAPVQLIAELLSHAHNVRRLTLDEFHPRIALALSSMQRLTQIKLSKVEDDTIEALQRIGNPKRLMLAYFVYDEEYADGGHTIPRLMNALARFPNLHTLLLWEFKPYYLDDEAPSFPPLPAVRYLLLSWAAPSAISIIEHCPNLSTLVFSGDFDFTDDTENVGPRWRPLRRVMLATDRDGVCVVDRLGPVSLLQVSGGLEVESETSNSFFLRLLRLASPVGLDFCLNVHQCRWALPSRFWKDFPSVVPALRSLELKLDWSIPQWSGEDYDQMLCQLLDTLGNIPLLVLKILVPPTSVPRRSFIFCGQKKISATYKRDLAAAKTREKERVSAVAVLPRPFVDAIPSLRYFSLADMAPNPALVDDVDAAESSDEPDSDDSENGGVPGQWDTLREIRPVKRMWWKVVEEDGQRSMIEICDDEGERMKREVELQDDEEMLQIEEAAAQFTL
ncbi:hypothetical protein V8D89_007103 [Ganoderma adspersum]